MGLCEHDKYKKMLLDNGYELYSHHELSSNLTLDTYVKDGYLSVAINYSNHGCTLMCSINYEHRMGPQFWEKIAATSIAIAYLENYKFIIPDNEQFMKVIIGHDYNNMEMGFRQLDIERSLEVLDGI